METSDLTPQQARHVAERLAPMLGYLVRLTDRMQKRGWRADDAAYRAAWRARDEMHELCVRLRYHALGNPGAQLPPPAQTPSPPPRPWEPGGAGRDGA